MAVVLGVMHLGVGASRGLEMIPGGANGLWDDVAMLLVADDAL